MSGHSRSGLMLLAAFSNTAHMERAKTRGSLGNKSQHNRPEQKSCSFFITTKGFVRADDIPAFFIDALQCINFNAGFHFPLQWCRILQLYFCFEK